MREIIDLVETKQKLELKKLPYGTTSLAPVMSKTTLDNHYGKLARGYVDRYNKGEGDASFNEAGAYLHNIFFPQLRAPKNGNSPSGASLALINRHFGNFTDFKKEFAEQAADAATSIASIIKDIKGNKTVQIINEAAWMTIRDIFSGEIFSLTPKGSIFNPDTPNVGRARRFFSGGQDSVLEAKRNKERAAAETEALRLAKERANLEKKAAMDAKKKAALEKAARTLELDRINITAALKGQISETDKLSLQLQLALLDKNDSQATKLAAELATATKNNAALQAALIGIS